MPKVKKHIRNGTRVEVSDEGRWHRGGTIIGYTPETGDYMIQWAAWGNEITTANEVDVRPEVKVQWKPVKHQTPFSVTATKSRYTDFVEANHRPVEQSRSTKAEDPANQEGDKWAAPSGKPVTIPQWQSALSPAPKKTPLWEKRVNKFNKRGKELEARPAFGVSRKAKIPDWRPEYVAAPPPPQEHMDKRYMKYWGRFAPEQMIEEEYERELQTTPTKRRSPKRVERHEDPVVYSDAEAEEAEVEEQAEPAEEEPVEEPVAAEPAAEEVAAPAEKEVLNAKEIYGKLGGTDTEFVEQGKITAEVEQYIVHEAAPEKFDAGVKTALSIAAPEGEVLDEEKFETFHTALIRYLTLADLYQGEQLSANFEEDPALFERSVPVISKWGIDMNDIVNHVSADHEVEQTLGWYLDWAVRQGMKPAEEKQAEPEPEPEAEPEPEPEPVVKDPYVSEDEY